MKRTIMHGLLAALCLALAFPLAAQSAAEEKIELPDVTTVVTGDTLTAGKEAIPDYSSVLPTAESGKIELPSLEKPEPKAAAASPVQAASQSGEKTVYAEGELGGGFPFLFLGDFAIYRATGNAPFSLSFTHRSAEDFADNKAQDGFFARTTAVGAVQSLNTERTENSFSASYDTADFGLQSLSTPYFDMVNHTISLKEDSRFSLPYGWFITVGTDAAWYNRYGGSKSGSSDYYDADGNAINLNPDDVTSHTVTFDLSPRFGFGWQNDMFKAGFTAQYQAQGNLGDGNNFYKYDASTYRNATHRGEFGVNAAVSTKHAVFRGDVAIVVGSALGKSALIAPFTVGTDLFIPYDEETNRVVKLTLEGGLDSYQATVRELEKMYRYSYAAVLPSETTEWYGKAEISVPLFESLSANADATFRKTAFENGVWQADYTGSRDSTSALYLLLNEERTDLETNLGVTFDWNGISYTAAWEAHWLDVPSLEEEHALLFSAAYQSAGDRYTLEASYKQALGSDADLAPNLGASATLRASQTLRLALEANDIVKLCAATTRAYAHSAYKAESGSIALLVKFQF